MKAEDASNDPRDPCWADHSQGKLDRQYGELLVWILLVGRGTKYFAQSGRDAGVYFVLGRAATTEE